MLNRASCVAVVMLIGYCTLSKDFTSDWQVLDN
jgi:hypothetical protein